MTRPGTFVISLDFELRWGVRDVYPKGEYDAWLLGGRRAIPRMLTLFEQYEISATWAAVGMLFARDRDELMAFIPETKPSYKDPRLSPYADLQLIGEDERRDPLSYAPSLLDQIVATPRQELGTHTFSHYYAVERGQTEAQFAADLAAARAIGERYGELRSLVLPRNQWNSAYATAAAKEGVSAYRVNREHWAYSSARTSEESLARRAFRLGDAYLPLSGSTVIRPVDASPRRTVPREMVASQFLRPWTPRFRGLERLRIARITRDMERAARTGGVFHLWWHPHNFGQHTEENLKVLDSILRVHRRLAYEHGMRSASMGMMAPAPAQRSVSSSS